MRRIAMSLVLVVTALVGGLGNVSAQPADAASECISSIETSGDNPFYYSMNIENEIVEIISNDSVVVFHDTRELVNLEYIRGMDLVVEPDQRIRSTESLDGVLWFYPPACEVAHVIEFVIRDRDYRASYDVPVGWFFADWRNTGVFQQVQ